MSRKKARLLEVVGVRGNEGGWLLFHATTPPSDKTFREFGIAKWEMEFKAENGAVLTDDMLDAMAQEHEEGAWEGHGEITSGRPKLYDEDMETVSFRLPRSRVAAIEAVASRRGITKSEFYRRAVDRELIALG